MILMYRFVIKIKNSAFVNAADNVRVRYLARNIYYYHSLCHYVTSVQ